MGAFSFLNGSKKSQQQRSQGNGQSQLSPHYAQDNANNSNNAPYNSSSLSSRRSPTPASSPGYSTISFFSNSKSTLRSTNTSDTYSSHQTSFDSESRSVSPAPQKKSRPSLNIIRGAAIPRLSLSREDSTESGVPSISSGRGRSPIYMRFGFSKSSSNIPPEVPTPVEAKSARKRRNTKDSKFDGESEDARSFISSHPPTPIRNASLLPPLEPVPASPPLPDLAPSSVYTIPSFTSFPTLSTQDLAENTPSVPPRDNVSTGGLRVPTGDDDDDDGDFSTSLLLQRRRAKSLGNPSANEKDNVNPRIDPAHRITNLKLPAPAYPPLPGVAPTPTGTTLTLPPRVTSRSSSPTTSPGSTPTPTIISIPVPRTPMTATSTLCSGSSRARSESNCADSSRTRSESGCSSPSPLLPFLRTRSESGSSRARSESNASSGSRNSSKAKSRVTMIKMEDLWGEFLKEVDEDMHELCTTPLSKARTPTSATTPVRKVSSPPPLPCSGSQNDVVKPLSTTSATFSSMPSPSVLLPTQRTRGKTLPSAVLLGKDLDGKRDPSPFTPTAPLISVENQDTKLKDVNNDGSDALNQPSFSSSTTITIVQTDINTDTISTLESGDSLSSLPYLYSPNPSMIPPGDNASLQSLTPDRDSTLLETSRPDSTCSEFSQFSLSLFPAPPSVSVIRPTTRIGTFRVGPATPDENEDADEEKESFPFKPILARFSESEKPPSAWKRTNLRPKPGLSTSRNVLGGANGRYSSLFSSQASSIADSTLPPTPTSSEQAADELPPKTSPNYEALLRSMDANFPVATPGVGGAGSRPGTADGKFQQWGYAF